MYNELPNPFSYLCELCEEGGTRQYIHLERQFYAVYMNNSRQVLSIIIMIKKKGIVPAIFLNVICMSEEFSNCDLFKLAIFLHLSIAISYISDVLNVTVFNKCLLHLVHLQCIYKHFACQFDNIIFVCLTNRFLFLLLKSSCESPDLLSQ